MLLRLRYLLYSLALHITGLSPLLLLSLSRNYSSQAAHQERLVSVGDQERSNKKGHAQKQRDQPLGPGVPFRQGIEYIRVCDFERHGAIGRKVEAKCPPVV